MRPVDKTKRQARSTQGYKASAAWQTASLLRDLAMLHCQGLPPRELKRKSQIESNIRSFVANIEEGWARPSTKEFLDFLGFSQASLAEFRGDVERLGADGLLESETGKDGNPRESTGSALERAGIPTPSRNLPYPPVRSRQLPGDYGSLREKLREYTGKEIKRDGLTYEAFTELINKLDFLFKRQVEGLQRKMERDEEAEKKRAAYIWERKYW